MDDINFLLDEEKKNIEEDILKKHTADKEEINEPINKPENLNKKKKSDLINEFLKLQEVSGGGEWDEKKLKRLNKDEIIKLIANFMNAKMNETETKIIENAETGKPEIIEIQKEGLSGEKLLLVSEGLFQINLAFAGLLESGSVYFKNRTYDIALLENFTKKLENRKKDLIIIFSQIYCDYKAELDKYLSPLVQYSIVMFQSASTTIIENLDKKKKEQKEN